MSEVEINFGNANGSGTHGLSSTLLLFCVGRDKTRLMTDEQRQKIKHRLRERIAQEPEGSPGIGRGLTRMLWLFSYGYSACEIADVPPRRMTRAAISPAESRITRRVRDGNLLRGLQSQLSFPGRAFPGGTDDNSLIARPLRAVKAIRAARVAINGAWRCRFRARALTRFPVTTSLMLRSQRIKRWGRVEPNQCTEGLLNLISIRGIEFANHLRCFLVVGDFKFRIAVNRVVYGH